VKNLKKRFIFISSACMAALATPAFAQNIPAKASGNWEDPSVWAGNVVPNSSNNVYIGATDPAGAVTTASVTLTANESAIDIHVGYGTPCNGTLNLNGHSLTISSLYLGQFGNSPGHIIEAGGSLTMAGINMFGAANSLTLGTADTVSGIDIESGAVLTTSAIGNISTGGAVANGGVLTLGANASLSGGLNVEGAGGSALNLAGHNLTINSLDLGYFSNSSVNFNRGSGTPGTLTVTNLNLANAQNLALIAGDTITNIDIENGANLTTAATGNITVGGSVASATLNLGADMSLTGGLNVENLGATLNLAGHNFTAPSLALGFFGSSSVTLNRGSGTLGTLSLGSISLGNAQNLTLIAGDAIGAIDVENGATLTTAATGNITVGGNVVNGAALNLGANMSLSGALSVAGTGAALNLNGHNLSAGTLDLGFFGTSSVTLNRGSGTPGTLSLNSLNLANGQNVTLVAGDNITGGGINGVGGTGAITLNGGAILSTVSATNVTCTVNVVASTLNLGANMNIGNQTVNEATGGTVNLNGHNLAASFYLLGYAGTGTVTLNRGSGTPGTLTIGNLFIGNGQNLTLIAGDTVSTGDLGITVATNATLTTSTTSNISNNVVNVVTGGTLRLGANLSTTGTLNIQDGNSLFDAQNHGVSAGKLFFGASGTSAVTVSNLGTVTASELHEGHGTSVTLHTGDAITGIADLEDNSALSVQGIGSLGIGGTLTMNGSASFDSTAPLIKLGGLSINGTSKLNLELGKMIVSNTPLATIKGYIATGYASGSWNGNGIFSTTAQTSGGKTAIGYATASSIGVGSFAGQSVNPTDTLIRYTYYGDANLDGKVNLLDLNALATNFGKTSKLWSDGDSNFDGTVNIQDFNALAGNFGATPIASPPALGALVPEPAMLGILGVSGLTLLRRRRA
jgi:hypothetical protein